MQLCVEVNDDQVSSIVTAFGLGSLSEAERDRALKQFCQVAVKMQTEWIAGRARYRSLTDLNLQIVQELYETILPDEQPTPHALFNNFNLPYGQAAYLARVLAEKDIQKWRTAALKELALSVSDLMDEKKDVNDKVAKDTFARLEISVAAARELKNVCDDIKKCEPKTFMLPEYGSPNGSYLIVKITVATLRRINTQLSPIH
jgi:hypothetical protein